MLGRRLEINARHVGDQRGQLVVEALGPIRLDSDFPRSAWWVPIFSRTVLVKAYRVPLGTTSRYAVDRGSRRRVPSRVSHHGRPPPDKADGEVQIFSDLVWAGVGIPVAIVYRTAVGLEVSTPVSKDRPPP